MLPPPSLHSVAVTLPQVVGIALTGAVLLLAIVCACVCLSRRRNPNTTRKQRVAAPAAGLAVDVEGGAGGAADSGARQGEVTSVDNEHPTWLGRLHRTSLEAVSTQTASTATEMVSLSSVIAVSLDHAEHLHSASIAEDRDTLQKGEGKALAGREGMLAAGGGPLFRDAAGAGRHGEASAAQAGGDHRAWASTAARAPQT